MKTLTDLKMLIDVAYAHQVGSDRVQTATGFVRAKNRLVQAGLLQRDPYDERWVRITTEGEKLVEEILNIGTKKRKS